MAEHEGPCLNYEGQAPEDYTEHEPCIRHVEASAARKAKEAAVIALARRVAALPAAGDHERYEATRDLRTALKALDAEG